MLAGLGHRRGGRQPARPLRAHAPVTARLTSEVTFASRGRDVTREGAACHQAPERSARQRSGRASTTRGSSQERACTLPQLTLGARNRAQ
eukprot:7391509-Prymnesium_polylepis.1